MLDDFAHVQPIVYKILSESKKRNRVSHAYIIETNGYSKGLELAISFCKYLLCPNSYTNNKNCKDCTQCFKIDNNEFVELKIIESSGQQIKKNQIEELQIDFSKKPVIGDKKIYIINEAEKLNVKTSNSILKFIEEPEEGIIAILITKNVNSLLPTIVSRCQILSLKNRNDLANLSTKEKIINLLSIDDDLNIKNEEKNKVDKIVNFIKYYENNKTETIIYTNKLFHSYFIDRDNLKIAFEMILMFYKDVLNNKLGKEITIFNDYNKEIEEISFKNKLEIIIKKINIIANLKEKIKYNANATLLVDKLIIELEGCE